MLSLSFMFCSRYECFKYKNTVNYPMLFILITYSFIVSIVSNFFWYLIFSCMLAASCHTNNPESLPLPVKNDLVGDLHTGLSKLKPLSLNYYTE